MPGSSRYLYNLFNKYSYSKDKIEAMNNKRCDKHPTTTEGGKR